MRCPSLEELPLPPSNKFGWPWTVASERLPERMADGSDWPKISIVTPNYNYERYLEATIRSVLLQGYPNVEFIVEDGGSTDGSDALLARYEKYLSWASRPGCGQQASINLGLHGATGSILAYINSDDYYAPNAFGLVAGVFREHPEVDWIYGRCQFVDERGQTIRQHLSDIASLEDLLDVWNVWWKDRYIVQPETFWRRRIWERVGDFRTDLKYVFDYEYWCRLFRAEAICRRLDADIACFRVQPSQKTKDGTGTVDEELAVVADWIWDPTVPISRKNRRLLQGQWLYDRKFGRAVERSLTRGNPAIYRWLKLAGISALYPQLWRVPEFRRRLAALVRSLTNRSTPQASRNIVERGNH
jgi:glycosyltransferase involved in cell wall biosynthesis